MTQTIPVTQSPFKELLGIRNFRMLWFGQVFSQLAGNTLLFVLALRVYQSTASNTAVSGLFLAFGVPSVLFGLVAGTAVDRLDKRRVLFLCDFVRAILTCSLLFVSHQVLLVYILTFLNSIITQFYVPSEAPLIPKIVPKQLLVTANSLFSFTFFTSLAIGTIVAGPLLRLFGQYGIFVCISMLFLLASYFSFRISSQSAGTVGIRYIVQFSFLFLVRRIFEDLSDGIQYITKSKTLFDAILLLTGTQIIFAFLGTLGPGFADKVLGIDVRDASLVMVAPAVVGILVGVVWVGWKGRLFRPTQLIRFGLLLAGLALLGIALLAQLRGFTILTPVIFLLFMLGVANSLLDVPSNAILQQHAHGSMRGRVYGMLTAFVGGVGVLPIIIGGYLADTIGVVRVIFFLGCAIVLYGVYRIRYVKD